MKNCDCGKEIKDHHTKCVPCRSFDRTCPQCGVTHRSARNLCSSCTSEPGNRKARDRRFNLEPGQYDLMLQLQGGLCQICHLPEKSVSSRTGKSYSLPVDHDRTCCPGDVSCGECVRGLICRNCNVLLGMSGNSPEVLASASLYLEEWKASQDSRKAAQAGEDFLTTTSSLIDEEMIQSA
jgi:hypothetical protein